MHPLCSLLQGDYTALAPVVKIFDGNRKKTKFNIDML
jgi:hypothetical protein